MGAWREFGVQPAIWGINSKLVKTVGNAVRFVKAGIRENGVRIRRRKEKYENR